MLKDKVAIVTGSTSGIGLGIAQALGQAGCHIVLNGFGDSSMIDTLCHNFANDYHIKTRYANADMSKVDQIKQMIQETEDQWGSVDILVNNAGIQHTDPLEDFPANKWESILAINLSAAFYGSQAVLPGMKRRGWGRIINIASAHALVGSVHKAAYVAAKHGLLGLTKVIALESAPFNIACNAICPGWVETPLVQKQIEDLAQSSHLSLEEARLTLLSVKQPSGRFVKTDHLGQAVLFLCSDAGSSMTGSPLSLDGGWTAQ